MTFMWPVVIVVVVGIALLGALVLGRRRLGGMIRGIRERRPVTPGPAAQRSPTERPSRPQRARQSAPLVTELVVVGTRVRVTASSGGLVVVAQKGSSWGTHVEHGWSEIDKACLRSGRYDAPLALYVTTSCGERKHLVDSQQLNRGQWSELASAVAAWTSGRVVIDLSPLDDPGSFTDI